MLVEQHCEAVENDLSRYHGRRLQDLFTGRMSWREMGIYLDRLPPESSLRTEIRDQFTDQELMDFAAQNADEKHGPWSRLELLTASLINELRNLTYVELVMNGNKGVPKPEPVRTPGSGGTFRKPISPEAAAYLQSIRDRHKQETG